MLNSREIVEKVHRDIRSVTEQEYILLCNSYDPTYMYSDQGSTLQWSDELSDAFKLLNNERAEFLEARKARELLVRETIKIMTNPVENDRLLIREYLFPIIRACEDGLIERNLVFKNKDTYFLKGKICLMVKITLYEFSTEIEWGGNDYNWSEEVRRVNIPFLPLIPNTTRFFSDKFPDRPTVTSIFTIIARDLLEYDPIFRRIARRYDPSTRASGEHIVLLTYPEPSTLEQSPSEWAEAAVAKFLNVLFIQYCNVHSETSDEVKNFLSSEGIYSDGVYKSLNKNEVISIFSKIVREYKPLSAAEGKLYEAITGVYLNGLIEYLSS